MNAIKHIAIAAAVLALGGCAKWTEQEPVQVLYPTLKDKNPELYAQYMESIRAYRASEHQVLIAKFDNKAEIPSGRADHLDCLPDSVDFVILLHPDGLSESIRSEMASIREEKAVRTLMEINYNTLVKEWEALLAEEKEAREADSGEEQEDDPRGVDDTDRFVQWMGAQVDAALAVADKYGYDGINAVFSGRNPYSFTESAAADARTRYDAFFQGISDWAAAGADRILLLEGDPKSVLSATPVLEQARYLIIPCESLMTVQALSVAVRSVLAGGVPSDKFVVGITALDVTDETATDGLFSGETSAIVGAARWAVSPEEGIGKKGICVNHAQFDYYNIQHVYSQIGAAISIMNPSPVK